MISGFDSNGPGRDLVRDLEECGSALTLGNILPMESATSAMSIVGCTGSGRFNLQILLGGGRWRINGEHDSYCEVMPISCLKSAGIVLELAKPWVPSD